MSRSRKRYAGYADRNPFMKRYANRRLRRLPVDRPIANGKSYRKHTCSYDICDWKCFEHVDTLQAYLIAESKRRFTALFGWMRICDATKDDLIKQYWKEVGK